MAADLTITAYLKTHCGWSRGVRAIFDKYGLEYEEKDIIQDPNNYMEMVQLSGQQLSPCVIVNGVMLPDISGEEVEQYMLEQGLIQPNSTTPEHPTNTACTDAEHARMEQAAAEQRKIIIED